MKGYEKLMNTASQCGLKIISDDFCAKLLAWLMFFGDTEAVTYNVKLRTDIAEAQRRLNCYGGETPNNEIARKFRKYCANCGDWFKTKKPEWIKEIESKYNLG